MGGICGKGSSTNEKPVNGTGSSNGQDLKKESLKGHKASQEEVGLQTKKQFQQMWEHKNELVQSDITFIWGLAIAYTDITKAYTFDTKEIGSGHYGIVRRAKLKIEPSKIYAVKSIEKKKLKGDITLLKNELEMLRFTDHPNIIQFYEIYQDSINYHFVMEYCEGGDITTRVEKYGPMEEQLAKNIIFQVLYAINNLHTCGIIHRDIKPDNFLFKSKDPLSVVKLIDFGLSKKFVTGNKMHTVLGTPYYVAPEVIDKKGYSEKVDLWSTGVMLYLLMAADFPFKGETHSELFEKIRRGEYNMQVTEQLKAMSPVGRSLLRGLLEKNPETRLSAREALRHPWFDELNISLNEKGKKVLNKSLLSRLRRFRAESKFCKEVIRLLVMIHDDSPQVMQLKDAFFYLDVLDNGVINDDELKKAFTDLGEEISDREITEIIHGLELRTTNVITYTEFVTATIDGNFYKNEKYLTEAFNRFDIDQDKFISYADVKDCFSRFGIELSKSDILKMISEFDENSDLKISYEEFIKIMKRDFHQDSVISDRNISKRASQQDAGLHFHPS